MRNKIYYSAILAIMLVFCGMSAVFCQEKPVKDSGSLYSELEALAQKRNSAAVLEYVAEQQTKFQLSESDKYLLNMLNAGIKAGTDIQSIAYAVPPADMTQAVRSKIHFQVAKLFMHLRDYKKADYYGRTEPALRPGYKVIIVDEAPIGVYGWKNSSFVKDASKRETRFANYNEAGAAVLFTDVNANRTAAAVTKKAERCGVSFFVAADARGISCYVESKDDKKDEVMAGLAYGGMLEMYFQPGFDHVYYQWLQDLYPAQVSVMDWMSPHEHFRSLNGLLKYETAPIPEGFGAYMFIPWELIYDNLPTSESSWAFGIMPWTRDGGFTWGSGQVHELHKFGQIQFEGIEKLMPKIKRNLVLSAWGKFNKENGNIAVFWSDQIHGDQKFYNEVLAPYIAKLQAAGSKVSVNMDDAAVEDLFKNNVADWNEFRYRVDELRAAYLKKQMFAE